MSIEVRALSRLRLFTEPNGSFAVDNTASGSFSTDYTVVPAMEGTMEMTILQDTLDPLPLQQFKDGRFEKVLGRKSATLSFKMPLAPTGTAATNNVAAVQGSVGKILSIVLGGENLSTGDVISDASPGVTNNTMSENPNGNSILAGTAVGILPSGSSTTEWRVIDTVTSTDINLKLAMSAAPANGATVNGCATYYLTEDPNTTLQFLVEGVEEDDRWLLLGGQLESMGLEIVQGQIPVLTFNFQFAHWLDNESVAGTANAGSTFLTSVSYTNYSPIVAVAGAMYQQVVGTTTYSATNSRLNVTNESYSPGIGYAPVPSPSGTQGIFRFVRSRSNSHAMTGSFSVPYENLGSSTTVGIDWKNNKRDIALVRQIGSGTPGSTILVEFPTVQIVNMQPADEGGLAYQRLDWESRLDSETGVDTALGRSAFRIHIC